MRKHDGSLFQIGEVAKILGLSRKMILNYEDQGLVVPAVKDEVSGYRYYTADNMTRLRSIRTLQSLGLSLKEVAEYYYDTTNIDRHLQRLMEMRDALDKSIEMLQVRSAKSGDFTIHSVALPRQICFCRQYTCTDVSEAAIHLRNTYIAAARTGYMSMVRCMFTVRQTAKPDTLHLLCSIPVEDCFNGPERREFPETLALCIYYRGPYEGIGDARRALKQYVKENNISVSGYFRSIFLEGPPTRGTNSADYITQVAVPIADR
ncbi:MerR family transcriptional regulator [Diplocloster modestus]|uniref:MerR family transcriptional regulator n=1 Tax=Diplocloster modestus TaxID=2850322 RepID=A0ABS6K310_9FIRM|nr:MerR family transcriptional regulator [Diplocloster modestus]MBU9724890.1 MerR family transcriptional regulator [Diplocloster modestus]